MIKKIIILGTGGTCIGILDAINDINAELKIKKYKCIGFLDDNKNNWGKEFWGIKVLGPLESAIKYPNSYFINGIGSSHNYTKKESIISKIGLPLERFENIIHPTASVSKMAQIGYGNVIFQNVVITSNVKIGNHVIILRNSAISHDDIIGDYTCITSGVCISGGVTIGKSCYLGANCSIKEYVKIGEYSLIGMGSVVLNNVPKNSVVVGNPARVIRVNKK